MRILAYEFLSGGGLAGRDVPMPLAREGSAMLTALVSDLAAIRQHRIVTTADVRFPLEVPAGVEVAAVSPRSGRVLDDLIASVDAVWLVAPETDRCLERLAMTVERLGKKLLGSGGPAIRRAADKAGLPCRLARLGLVHPDTRVASSRAGWERAAREMGYPVVVKPALGAGCSEVYLARNVRELSRIADITRRSIGRRRTLLQRHVPGVAASVSLLADGRQAVALAVNAQRVRQFQPYCYDGGQTPLPHALAGLAVDAAQRACQALGGLRGYIGVDLVLTETEAVVIEVNPRLTTSYLGVRQAFGDNIAALALAACAGVLPGPLRPRCCVRFTADGRILSRIPYAPRRSRLPATRQGASGAPRSHTRGMSAIET